MNNDEMNNMIKKAQEMIQNNQIPDELKNMVANMQKNGINNEHTNNSNQYSNNYNSNSHNNNYKNSNSFNNSNYNRNNNSNYSSNKQDYNKYSNTYSQRSNYSHNNNEPKNYNNNIDLNNIGELLKNFQMNNNTNEKNNSNNDSSDFPNIDVETMMRIQNIMTKMKSANVNDDMSQLLMSLKPYLRDEKKGKIDEYIKLIKMGKMTQMFDSFGGDKK